MDRWRDLYKNFRSHYLDIILNKIRMVHFMRSLLVAALVLLTSAAAYDNLFLKLYESQHRVKLLHEQLERECPNKFNDKDFKYSGKRSIFGSQSLRVRIDVENKLGDHLVDLLVECRRNGSYVTTTHRPYYNYTHTTRSVGLLTQSHTAVSK